MDRVPDEPECECAAGRPFPEVEWWCEGDGVGALAVVVVVVGGSCVVSVVVVCTGVIGADPWSPAPDVGAELTGHPCGPQRPPEPPEPLPEPVGACGLPVGDFAARAASALRAGATRAIVPNANRAHRSMTICVARLRPATGMFGRL